MLAADSDFQIRTSLAAALGRHLHQLADALAIKHRKRILLEDAFRKIGRQHLVDVVAREAEGGLREIVGAERKELRFFGDLIRDQRRARQLDHGADQVVDLLSFLFEDFLRHAVDDRRLVRHFLHRRSQAESSPRDIL